jgi:alanine racemase
MSLKSRIAFLKWVEDQTPIGYGGTHTASGRRHIATVPIGYADGYSRRFSNIAQALVQGKRVPLVDKVCMDQCMFDVTDVSALGGDEIILMGVQGGVDITAEELAELMGTINYEVTCLVNKRVPRVFWRNGQAVRARTLLGRS